MVVAWDTVDLAGTALVMPLSVIPAASEGSLRPLPSRPVLIGLLSGIDSTPDTGSSGTDLSLSARLSSTATTTAMMIIVILVFGPAGAGEGCRSATEGVR